MMHDEFPIMGLLQRYHPDKHYPAVSSTDGVPVQQTNTNGIPVIQDQLGSQNLPAQEPIRQLTTEDLLFKKPHSTKEQEQEMEKIEELFGSDISE
jgi:hypothetical protein